MSNLNKTYHKGRFREREWTKHLRPYLKRLGNKRFRKIATSFEEDQFDKLHKFKKKRGRKNIRAMITISSFGDSTLTYTRNYRNMRDLQNALNCPKVIRHEIIKHRNTRKS